MFKELRNDFFNEYQCYYSIDGWRTSNPNEEGIVVAKVYKDKVTYRKPEYETVPEIIEIVNETKKNFR